MFKRRYPQYNSLLILRISLSLIGNCADNKCISPSNGHGLLYGFMVTPTEQDQRNTRSPSGEDFKHIVIKLPFDLQERLLAFPLLHQLRQSYPEAEIHFITPKHNIEVLNLLPFKAYYHEFDEDEISSVFDVHRYSVTAKIHQVDLFVNLTNSFADACLGLSFKAPVRLGFADGWKTLVLNRKILRPVNHHLTEDFLALYKELTGKEADAKMRIISRDLIAIMPEWDTQPYIAINLAPLRQAAIEDEWVELISKFRNQRIVLFSSEDQEKFQLLMEPFMAKLPPQNTYLNFIHLNWIELARMLAFSRGVITFNGPLASLSAYVGSRTMIMYDSEDPQRHGPFYFMAEVKVMMPPKAQMTLPDGQVIPRPRTKFNMTEISAAAWEFFKITM